MAQASDFVFLARALVATLVLVLAQVVWRAPFHQRSNRGLALFLAVVSAGFFTESAAYFFHGVNDLYLPLRLVQSALGFLDPPLLLSYALSFRAPRRRTALWAGYAAAALAAWALWASLAVASLNPDHQVLFSALEAIYTNGTYLVAFGLLLQVYLREPRRYLSEHLRVLVVAIGFIALSRTGAIPLGTWHQGAAPDRPLVFLLEALLLLAAAALVVRLATRPRRRPLRRVTLPLAALLAGFFAAYALFLGPGLFGLRLDNSYFALRWVVFGLVVGLGIVRHQMFDHEMPAWKGALALAASVAALAAGIPAGLLASHGGMGAVAARAVGLAAAAAAGAAVFAAGSLAWGWLRPEAHPRDSPGRRLRLYEAALEEAMHRRLPPEEERCFIDTLREVLEISEEEHGRAVGRLAPQGAAGGAAGSRDSSSS